MAWVINGSELYLESTGPALTPSTEEAKWQWRVDMFTNEGLPYNGYMQTNKSFPALKPAGYAYINLLDNVPVYSPPHGLDATFPVMEMKIPLASPEKTTYKLGKDKKVSLTSVNKAQNESLKKQLLNIPKASSILASAQENAAALINNATNGYVTMRQNSEGFVEELIISNDPDYEKATSVWVWNRGGLGFSSQGYQPDMFDVALTADGQIVADMITTGTMRADRIRGGQLKVGGIDYPSGGEQVGDDIKNAVSVYSDDEDYEMRMSGGAIGWYGYNSFDGTSDNHVGHIDSYGVPDMAEYPWLSLVTTGGLMLNPNNIGVMTNPSGDYVMCPRQRSYTVLDTSGSTDEEDPTTIEVVTDVEIDEETKRVKSVTKRTLSLVKLEFTHGLHTDINVKPS